MAFGKQFALSAGISIHNNYGFTRVGSHHYPIYFVDNIVDKMDSLDMLDKTGLRKGLTDYGDEAFSLFLRKAFIKGAGYTDDALDRPIVGIANTGSGFNPCHGNVPRLLEAVKRGVMLAGGIPIEFPTISIHESFSQPTSMGLAAAIDVPLRASAHT